MRKQRLSHLVFYSFICVAMYVIILFPSLASAADGETILFIPWGDASDEVGLVNEVEQEVRGPVSFATDGVTVFLMDSVHQRIVAYDEAGQSRLVAQDVEAWAICADYDGGVLAQTDTHVVRFNKQGEKEGAFSLDNRASKPPTLIEGYGNELFIDPAGTVCVRAVDQTVHKISGIKTASGFKAAFGETPSPSLNFEIKRVEGNEVRLLGLDSDGKVIVSVSVLLDRGTPGAVLFKGIDTKGNLYLEIESLQENEVGLEVHRYSPSGKRLACFKLSNDYFSTVYKKTELTPEGAVYQMLTTPEGVHIIRYK